MLLFSEGQMCQSKKLFNTQMADMEEKTQDEID